MNLKKLILHPIRSYNRLVVKLCALKCVSDKASINRCYKLNFKKKPDLKNPKTFNEKLNWMKLNYRKPELTAMVDKYEAKKVVASIIGEEYVIPSIAIFDKWEDIDFSVLKPPYVLKTTHSSGVIKVVKSCVDFDLKATKRIFKKSLKNNYFYHCREWPYKNVKPRIIVEKYMKDDKEDNLPVYKFFCFSGNPYIVQTIKNDKTQSESIDYFDMDWNFLTLRQNFKNSEVPLEKPANFKKMQEIAAKLAGNHPFVRVDLYSINGRIYFSEYTFFSDAGYQPFYPSNWDLKLGAMIKLS